MIYKYGSNVAVYRREVLEKLMKDMLVMPKNVPFTMKKLSSRLNGNPYLYIRQFPHLVNSGSVEMVQWHYSKKQYCRTILSRNRVKYVRHFDENDIDYYLDIMRVNDKRMGAKTHAKGKKVIELQESRRSIL